MAKLVVNPEAELQQRSGDIDLQLDELASLEIFSSVKKSPAFEKFPGTTRLRHYQAGDAICYQSRPGKSAFYMLTLQDLRNLSGEDDTQAENHPAEAPQSTEPPPKDEESTATREFRTQLAPVRSLYEKLNQQTDQAGEKSGSSPRRLATAKLVRDTHSERSDSQGLLSRTLNWLGQSASQSAVQDLQSIPNDGPADIDYESGQASIFEGEVFGEMSCLTRQPRSATVVADEECFALEFLRNVLDQMRRDPLYKKRSDQKYRERVMEGHVRNLSLFKSLTAEQFRSVADRIELVDLEPGKALFDEGDPSDSFYIVRSGFVKVVQAYPWRTTESSVLDWQQLITVLKEGSNGQGKLALVVDRWPEELKKQLDAFESDIATEARTKILEAFDQVAKSTELLVAKQLKELREHSTFLRETSKFGSKVKSWDDLEVRRANRVLFHLMLPEVLRPPEPIGVSRVLGYVGRGSTQGEMGLVLDQPRSATCVAYAHSEMEGEATNIELLRMPAELYHEIVDQSPEVRAEIQRLVGERSQALTAASDRSIQEIVSSRNAEDLGLLQGQKLMLIDLDRCTRCGDCVEACIDTHDDGYSRLYLDGPRYGNYLIPSSCRNCRDPVCMIGCPVGSIQQGEKGEVQIRDWCIGCGVCARQCPYDALQMHDRSLIPPGATGWRWISDDTHVAQNWMQPNASDREWLLGGSPFSAGSFLEWIDHANRHGRGRDMPNRYYFRYQFSVAPRESGPGQDYRVLLTARGGGAEAYLDGQPLEFTQDKKQERNGVFQAVLPADSLRVGEHVLAATVQAAHEAGQMLFDLQLDELPPEGDEFAEKLVSEHAVVCDQCSSLSGNRHACVYACPHEAALRVDGWLELPNI